MTDAATARRRQEHAVGIALTTCVVVALSIIVAMGMPADHFRRGTAVSDYDMYRAIAAAMADGETYLHAAVRILHGNHGPVNPPWTVRLPTLAWLMSVATEQQLAIVHGALALTSAAAWMVRLRGEAHGRPTTLLLVASVACAHYYAMLPSLTLLHESWAGSLVSIALATRRADRWWPALLVAAAACAIRETAVPLVAAMALCAAAERRPREAAAWCGLGIVVAIGYAWHFGTVRQAVEAAGLSDDPARSWWGLLGPGYALRDGVFATGLAFLPTVVGCALALAGCAGWLLARRPYSVRVCVYLLAWTAIMSILPDRVNFYWAAMYAQLMPIGLALLPGIARRGAAVPE